MRKLKLFFELTFIFIIPIVIILFSISFDKSKEYNYDNDGNIISEEEVKNVNISNLNWINTQTINNVGYKYVYYTNTEFMNFINSKNTGDTFNLKLYLVNYDYNFQFSIFDCILNNNSNYTYTCYFTASDLYETVYLHTSNNYELLKFTNEFINLDNENKVIVDVNFTKLSNNANSINFNYDNLIIKDIVEVTEYKNSNPLYDLFVFCEDSLGISTSSNVVKLINYYNCLWLLMWLIWHLVYGLADMFVHIFDRKELDVSKRC